MKRRQVGVIAALGTAQTLAWASSYYLPAVLANPIASDLGIPTLWVFAAFSAGLLISGTCAPFSGRLIDRHGGHWVLSASNLLFAAGLSGLAAASGPVTLIASWVILGAAMSCGLYEAAFSALARIYGKDARSSITGIALIAGFASTVGWPLTALLEISFGWRAACLVWAAVHVLICLPLNVLLPRGRHSSPAPAQPVQASTQRRNTWMMVTLSCVFAGTLFGSASMAAHLPRVLQDAGATFPAAIAAAALVGPAQVAARVVEFWLMRRFNPLTSAQVAALTHPVGAGILLATGAAAAPIFTVAHGAGNGVMTIARGTIPLHLFGPEGYGLRQGLLMLPGRFVQAAAPLVFDVLFSLMGAAALCATAACGLASFAMLTVLRKVAERR
jgi:MFS family permease